MSRKKRNAARTPAEVQADIERAPEQNRPGVDPRAEAIALLQRAREIEANVSTLGTEASVLRRLLIAVLESMTPEQRAEVRRRLGE